MLGTTRGYLYSLLGGCCTYIVEVLFAMLPYMNIGHGTFILIFVVCIALGVAITTVVLLYKYSTILQMILRSIMLFLSNICLFLLNGYAGTINALHKFFSIKGSSGSDNVSGLLMLVFLSVIAVTSIIVIAVSTIIKICSHKTGDG